LWSVPFLLDYNTLRIHNRVSTTWEELGLRHWHRRSDLGVGDRSNFEIRGECTARVRGSSFLKGIGRSWDWNRESRWKRIIWYQSDQ